MTVAERFLNRFEDMLPNLAAALIILTVGFIITRLTLKVMAKGLNIKHVDPTIHKFSMSLVKVTLTVIVVIMALSAMKVPMSSILAAIGTAGLAIGLALQDSLSNVAGGFLILFSKPFKCGDYIKVGEEEGTVDMISMLYTRLLTIDNRAIFIPNSSVAKSTVVNLTSEDKRRLELKLNISYRCDISKAKQVVLDTVNAEDKVLHSPDEPFTAVWEQAESSVVLVMRAWVKTEDYWGVRFDLLEKLKYAFDENGIIIPFGQLDVHIREKPESGKNVKKN